MVLIQKNENKHCESISTVNTSVTLIQTEKQGKLRKSEKTQQNRNNTNQTDKKKNPKIKKRLISLRSCRSGSEYHLRLLRRGSRRKTSPNRCSTERISQRPGETQRNEYDARLAMVSHWFGGTRVGNDLT